MRGWRDVPEWLDQVAYALPRRCRYLWNGEWVPGTLKPDASGFGADGRRVLVVIGPRGEWFSGGTWDVSFEPLTYAETT